jgi:hypothetical protein
MIVENSHLKGEHGDLKMIKWYCKKVGFNLMYLILAEDQMQWQVIVLAVLNLMVLI